MNAPDIEIWFDDDGRLHISGAANFARFLKQYIVVGVHRQENNMVGKLVASGRNTYAEVLTAGEQIAENFPGILMRIYSPTGEVLEG